MIQLKYKQKQTNRFELNDVIVRSMIFNYTDSTTAAYKWTLPLIIDMFRSDIDRHHEEQSKTSTDLD